MTSLTGVEATGVDRDLSVDGLDQITNGLHRPSLAERDSARLALVAEYLDVPAGVVERLRTICMALPDALEQAAWTGTRWQVRRRTFVHVLRVDGAQGPVTIMTFRSSGPELDALRDMGHPFFRPGWGTDVVGMVLDATTDFDEVAELLTESYCILAPKKLVDLVPRPGD